MSAAIAIPTQPATHVRRAHACDLEALVQLERAAWPSGEHMRADATKLARRIALGGLFVATRDARIVGALTTFRPRWADANALAELSLECPSELLRLPADERWRSACRRWRLPVDWHEATADGTLLHARRGHQDRDAVIFGVGLATDPRARGTRVAQSLLEHALTDARNSGAQYFLGYGRLPQYHASTLELDAYLRTARLGTPEPHDVGLRLHWRLGARPLRTRNGEARYLGIPGSMHDDPESRGAGVLIVNPLHMRSRFPFGALG